MNYPAQDPAAWLMQGGVKSASFATPAEGGSKEPPISWEGIITEIQEPKQSHVYGKPDELEWWDAAQTQPKMQVPVFIQTGERADDDDDGIRSIYFDRRKSMALKAAVKLAGVKAPEVGGWLKLTFTHWGTPFKPGAKPPKEWAAEYKVPAPKYKAAQEDPWAGVAGQQEAPQQSSWGTPPAASWGASTAPRTAAELADNELMAALKERGYDPTNIPDRRTAEMIYNSKG